MHPLARLLTARPRLGRYRMVSNSPLGTTRLVSLEGIRHLVVCWSAEARPRCEMHASLGARADQCRHP